VWPLTKINLGLDSEFNSKHFGIEIKSIKTTITAVHKNVQWMSKFDQDQEEKSAGINVLLSCLSMHTLSSEQVRLLEELEILNGQSMQPQVEQGQKTTGAQMNHKLASLQQQLEHVYALIASFDSSKQSNVVEALNKAIGEQIKYQHGRQAQYKNVLYEQKACNELLHKQVELLASLTQSQCRLLSELRTLESIEKLIQEQQFLQQFKTVSQQELTNLQWSEQVGRQQVLFSRLSTQVSIYWRVFSQFVFYVLTFIVLKTLPNLNKTFVLKSTKSSNLFRICIV
jgi:hypothetical protein